MDGLKTNGKELEMNVERLHAIALSIKEEIDDLTVVSLLGQLSSGLQNSINQPQNGAFQTQIGNSKTSLQANLASADSNKFSPAWNQTIEELGMSNLIGLRLSKKLDSIFLSNQVTPHIAMEHIMELHKEVVNMDTHLKQLIDGFRHFELGHEVLENGDGELGILLPREYLNNKFFELSKEFKELNGILDVLSEVSTGSKADFEIRSLSTSDPLIILGSSLGVLSAIAITVKHIVSAYKEILEVRVLHAKLAETVSSNRLEGIEKHAEEIMEKAIVEIKEKLLERYPGSDEGRKNELSNALDISLNKIANRIDRGVNIEVRVAPIAEGNEEESSDVQENIQMIQSAMSEMEFMKLEGEPILHLTELPQD